MPALRVFGQRLPYLAEDDLRSIAKMVLLLRLLQVCLLIPAGYFLVQTRQHFDLFHTDMSPSCIEERKRNVVWCTFCSHDCFFDTSGNVHVSCYRRFGQGALCAYWKWKLDGDLMQLPHTVYGSCHLHSPSSSFHVSSRGSPVQVEERKQLSSLCAIKLVPLSALRIATVVLALYTLAILKDLCYLDRDQLEEDCFEFRNEDVSSYDNESRFCPDYTVGIVSALAYTHVIETSIAAIVVMALTCRNIRSRHRQWSHEWMTMTSRWKSMRADRSMGMTAAPQNHGVTTNGRALLQLPVDYEDHNRVSWWHSFCKCCCVVTSCCTCCLFGGSEVVRSSSTSSLVHLSRRRHRNQKSSSQHAETSPQTSVLSDISMILADYFDTGAVGTLDVTPTDLLLGLTVMAAEQRRQKHERFALLQVELQELQRIGTGKSHDQGHGIETTLAGTPDIEQGGGAAIVSVESVATGSYDCGNDESSSGADSCDSNVLKPDNSGSVRNMQLHRTNSLFGQTYFKVSTRRRLKRDNEIDRCAILDGAHYIRIAIAVYGHLLYLLTHTCTAPCCLAASLLSCRGTTVPCRQAKNEGIVDPTIVGDNCCGCNELGFLQVAGLHRDDIAYISFKTGIQLCPYGIVVDRSKQTVVVAIRGTSSLEGMVTDLNIKPELLEKHCSKCDALTAFKDEYCHSGMLHCALAIYDDLERHQTLDRLLLGQSPRLPGYTVVIIGHSLGAGIGSILALMLSNRFRGLRCLCFSPPGCTMSEQACHLTQDYITSYVLESDIVPRMSFHSMVGLRNDVLEMIARIKLPKHIAISYDPEKSEENETEAVIHHRESIPDSTFYRNLLKFIEHQMQLKKKRSVNDVHLYPPGKIVHCVENLIGGSRTRLFGSLRSSAYIPVWAERSDFAEIQVTKSMANDHDPERLFRVLNFLAESFQ